MNKIISATCLLFISFFASSQELDWGGSSVIQGKGDEVLHLRFGAYVDMKVKGPSQLSNNCDKDFLFYAKSGIKMKEEELENCAIAEYIIENGNNVEYLSNSFNRLKEIEKYKPIAIARFEKIKSAKLFYIRTDARIFSVDPREFIVEVKFKINSFVAPALGRDRVQGNNIFQDNFNFVWNNRFRTDISNAQKFEDFRVKGALQYADLVFSVPSTKFDDRQADKIWTINVVQNAMYFKNAEGILRIGTFRFDKQ